jgi:Uma2 family endonuclease
MVKTTSPVTYEDLLKVPDHLVAEIIDGELFTSPRPGMRHARAASLLGAKLGPPFDLGEGGPGGWWIIDEPELHLGRDILVPGLSGWRRERMPTYPDAAYCEVAPDWVCEVVSPWTARLDRVYKMPKHAEHSVPHLWMIDPVAKTLEVFRLEKKSWILRATYGDDDRVRAEPFEAVEIGLQPLWV